MNMFEILYWYLGINTLITIFVMYLWVMYANKSIEDRSVKLFETLFLLIVTTIPIINIMFWCMSLKEIPMNDIIIYKPKK